MNVYDFILGFLGCAVLSMVLGGVYAFWRYAYTPFKVVRQDMKAIVARQEEQADKHNQLVEAFKKSQGMDRPRGFSDEEMANVEADRASKLRWR